MILELVSVSISSLHAQNQKLTHRDVDSFVHACVFLCLFVYIFSSGPPQQYPGQEDYYGEQYSHGGQGAPEGKDVLLQPASEQWQSEILCSVVTTVVSLRLNTHMLQYNIM